MRLPFTFALVLLGCARAPQAPVVPREPRSMPVLHAGDAIRIDAWNDEAMAGTYVLDSAGAIEIAMCGRVELGGIAEADATNVVRRCLVAAGAYADPIHVHVRVVHRGATITVRTDTTTCAVAYAPGITVMQGIAAAHGFGQGRIAGRVVLRRAGAERVIDVVGIANGAAVDEPLEAGDELVLDGRRSAKCMAKIDPPPRAETPDPDAPPVPDGSTCGELLLEEAELGGQGKGAAHPEVIATARAREFRCKEGSRVESLRAACDAVKQRQVELSSDYGPAHPTMVGISAALAVCAKELDQR